MEDLLPTKENPDAIALLQEMANAAGFNRLPSPGTAIPQDSHALEPSTPGGAKVWQPDLRYRSLVEKLPVVTFMASLDEAMQEAYTSARKSKQRLLGVPRRRTGGTTPFSGTANCTPTTGRNGWRSLPTLAPPAPGFAPNTV